MQRKRTAKGATRCLRSGGFLRRLRDPAGPGRVRDDRDRPREGQADSRPARSGTARTRWSSQGPANRRLLRPRLLPGHHHHHHDYRRRPLPGPALARRSFGPRARRGPARCGAQAVGWRQRSSVVGWFGPLPGLVSPMACIQMLTLADSSLQASIRCCWDLRTARLVLSRVTGEWAKPRERSAMRKRATSWPTFALIVAGVLGVGVGWAVSSDPSGAQAPTTSTFVRGNPTCGALVDSQFQLKIDPAADGTFTDGTLTVTIDETGGTFSFTSNIGVSAVFVKAGNGGILYTFDPQSTGETLASPKNSIGHILFCYDVSAPTTSTAPPTTMPPPTTSTAPPQRCRRRRHPRPPDGDDHGDVVDRATASVLCEHVSCLGGVLASSREERHSAGDRQVGSAHGDSTLSRGGAPGPWPKESHQRSVLSSADVWVGVGPSPEEVAGSAGRVQLSRHFRPARMSPPKATSIRWRPAVRSR